MSWEETRESARTVVSTARAVAHADDAKHRVDEGSGLKAGKPVRAPGGGLPKWLLPVGAVAALVIGGGSVALIRTSSDPKPPPSAVATQSPSASQTPTIALADTEPKGRYTVQMRRVVSQPSTQTEYRKRRTDVWTFESAGCSETECIGQVSSRLDNNWNYTWTGATLLLAKDADIYNKAQCIDSVTGVHLPDSGFVTMRTDYVTQPLVPSDATPLTGPPTALKAKLGYKWTYKRWWPTCSQKPKDPEYAEYVVTAIKKG